MIELGHALSVDVYHGLREFQKAFRNSDSDIYREL